MKALLRLVFLALLELPRCVAAQAARPDDCYALQYTPINDSSAVGYMPTGLALQWGLDSGKVLSVANAADTIGFWRMFQNSAARWVTRPGDSLQVQFDNGFTFVTYNMTRRADSLSGNATVHFDFGDPKDHPRVMVHAKRLKCTGLAR
jgi:hypothetical protein